MDSVEVVATRAGVEVTAWSVQLAGRPAREALDELARLTLDASRDGYEVEFRGHGAAWLMALLGIGADVRGADGDGDRVERVDLH